MFFVVYKCQGFIIEDWGGDICTLDPSQSKLVYSVYHAPKCFKSDGWENRISCVHVVGPLNEEGRWCGRGEVPR